MESDAGSQTAAPASSGSAGGASAAENAGVPMLPADTSSMADALVSALGLKDDEEAGGSGSGSGSGSHNLTQVLPPLTDSGMGPPDVADPEGFESGPNDSSDDEGIYANVADPDQMPPVQGDDEQQQRSASAGLEDGADAAAEADGDAEPERAGSSCEPGSSAMGSEDVAAVDGAEAAAAPDGDPRQKPPPNPRWARPGRPKSEKGRATPGFPSELLKLSTVMDFGQDGHLSHSRFRERKKPEEPKDKEGEGGKKGEGGDERSASQKAQRKAELEREKAERAEAKAAKAAEAAKAAAKAEKEREKERERKEREREKKEREKEEARKREEAAQEQHRKELEEARIAREQEREQLHKERLAKLEEKMAAQREAEEKEKRKAEEEKEKRRKLAERRETESQKQQVMERLAPCQQLLMLGFLPEEADLSVWSEFGTLANGQLEIRRSMVHRIIGSYELGRGLFACRDFAQNEIITVYGGELITSDEARSRKEDMSTQSRRYLMRISDSDFLVDGWQFAEGISDVVDEEGLFKPKVGSMLPQSLPFCGVARSSSSFPSFSSFPPRAAGVSALLVSSPVALCTRR